MKDEEARRPARFRPVGGHRISSRVVSWVTVTRHALSRPAVNRHAVSCLILLCLLTGCGRDDRLSVYLITLDTTRADHLGCYGHSGIETPAIDRLAAEGVRYDNAFTVAPITLPAHTSILTGTYPIHHGVRTNSGFYVPPEAITLAEILQGEGYDTAAFVGAFPLDSQTGLDQGFDLYDDNYPSSLEQGKHPVLSRFFDERPAAEVSRAAIAWLQQRSTGGGTAPFFLWTHYFDPHQPQQPPSPYRERYASSPYDGEIASVDEAVGQVLRRLEEDGQLDRTLVILTADHGEGLGEHGELTHALLLYSSTLRVPLIFRDPKMRSGSSVASPVSVVDIVPTILERLGLPAPAASQGVPLPQSDTEANAEGEREIYSETLYGRMIYGWSPLERLTAGSKTLIRGPSLELYDRSSDTHETDELSGATPAELKDLARRLHQQKTALAVGGRRASRGAVSEEARGRLAALGYVSGSASGTAGFDEVDAARPEPAAMMPIFELDMEAGQHIGARRFELAVPVLRRATALDPENPELLRSLAQAHLGMGAMEAGRRVLDKLLGIAPEDIAAHLLLSRYHQAIGEHDRALALLAGAAELNPADLSTRLLLAYRLEDAGRLAAAEEAYRFIVEAQNDHALAMNGLATLLYRQGEVEPAMELFEAALAAQPFFASAWLNLGVIEYDRGNTRRSQRLAERALALRPGYPQAQALLARNRATLGEEDEP